MGPWAALAGGLLGTGKYFLSDKPNYNADSKAASEQTRYSSWSGLGAGKLPNRPSLFNNVLQGASAGAMMGQGLGGAPGGGGGVGPMSEVPDAMPMSQQISNYSPSRGFEDSFRKSSPTFGGGGSWAGVYRGYPSLG